MADRGWKKGKFVVKHYRRGDIMDGEAFVLVPERDPAAVHALRAYAEATPDPELALRLREWVGSLEGVCGENVPPTIDKLPSWVSTLATKVSDGHLDLRQALWLMSKYILAEQATTHGGDNHE
jgi:hypothetical protein